MDKLMFETKERFAALIALTFEQATDIMDNFLKQVDAIAHAAPQGLQRPLAEAPKAVVLEQEPPAPVAVAVMESAVVDKPVSLNSANPAGLQGLEDFIPDYNDFTDFRNDSPLPSPPRSPSPPPQPSSSPPRLADLLANYQKKSASPPPPQAKQNKTISCLSDEEEDEEDDYVEDDDDDGIVPDSVPVQQYTAEEYGDAKLPDEDEVEEAEREIRRQKAKAKKREREKEARPKGGSKKKAAASPPPPPSGRRGRGGDGGGGERKYAFRSNPKKTRIYSDAEYGHQKENDPGEDLYDDEHPSSIEERQAHGEKERPGQANDVEELRTLLRQIHKDEKSEHTLIQHLDRSLWGRTQFLQQLVVVRHGLGHDDKRNWPAKELFDKIMNDADPHSVRENQLSGRAMVKCALCCIAHYCPNFVQFEGERNKYPLANYCIQIASSLGDFCHYLKILAEQMPDRAGPNELKLLQQKFEKVLEAHENKQNGGRK